MIAMMPAKTDEYAPTCEQTSLLKAYLESEEPLNIEALCRKAGVCKDVWYRIRNHPEPLAWWNRQVTARAEKTRSDIHEALRRLAANGDVQAIKIYLERFDPDYAPRSRRETSGRLLIEAKERRALPDWQQHALEVEGQGQLSAPADGDPVPSAEVPEPQETPVEGGATPQECSELRENTPTGADSAQETAVEGEAGEG